MNFPTLHSLYGHKGLRLLFSVFAGLIIWLMPLAGTTPLSHKTLAFFITIFLLYLTEALPLALTSLAIAPLAILLQLASLKSILIPYSSNTVFLLIGAFIMAAAMLETGLAKRLTYLILHYAGTSTRQITLGITAANILLGFLIPSTTARTAILMPPCLSLIGLFPEEKSRRFGANLLLTLALPCSIVSAGIYTGTISNPVVNAFLGMAKLTPVSYTEWLVLGFVPTILMVMLTWLLIQKLFPPEEKQVPGGKAFVDQKLAEMGSMTYDQRYTLIVFLIAIFFWFTGSLFQVAASTVCVTGALLLLLPEVGVLDWKTACSHINGNVLLIAGGGMALGTLLMENGTAAYLADQVMLYGRLDQLSPYVFLFVLLLLTQLFHVFFVGTTVMITALLPMVIPICQQIGIDPKTTAVLVGMLCSGYPLLMVYCTTPNILVQGTGKVAVHDFPKIGLPVSLIAVFVYLGYAILMGFY